MASYLVKSIPDKFKIKAYLKKFFSKASLDRWVLILVSVGLFLHWVKYPLSGGINSFNLYSPILLSWGLLFLIVAISAIIRNRWFLVLILLIIVLYFPLQIHWNYKFVQDIFSQTAQIEDIKRFAQMYVYEPNIAYSKQTIKLGDIWNDPLSRVFLTIESLGVGFWIAFIGTLIVSRKLGRKKFIVAVIFSLILSLPGVLSASFLTLGRSAFLKGDYLKSLDRYKVAMK